MTILIADSGSTKSNWRLLNDRAELLNFKSLGINPYVNDIEEIKWTLNEVSNKIDSAISIDYIYFYCAGCSNDEMISKVREAFLSSKLKSQNLEINHDLMAAARALFGRSSGIACILGTGSNSALYNGKSILDNIPSLGYVIGDEGGGLDIGRRLLNAVFKRKAPQNLIDQFFKDFDLDVRELLNNIHFKERPNRFIASFSKFVNEHIEDSFCRDLVKEAFKDFLEKNVFNYADYKNLPISFIGSVATIYQNILVDLLSEYNLKVGEFIDDPMERLVEYHLKELS